MREPTQAECRDAVRRVEAWQVRAHGERGRHWAYGADELYLRARLELPPEASYEGFDQVENGVGSVRFLQRAIREADGLFTEWSGRRIGVVTGTAMGALMPQVLTQLTALSNAEFELIVVENGLFGPGVTTAGLLPGKSIADPPSEPTPIGTPAEARRLVFRMARANSSRLLSSACLPRVKFFTA